MEKLSSNFAWMAASNIVSSLFGIILFIYLARALGPEAFGYISYVFTLIFFLYNFIDMGLSTYGIREVAKHKKNVSIYVSEIVTLRLFIAVILSILLVTGVSLFARSSITKVLALESSLMLISLALATEWAFQGIEDMRMVFISFAVTSILQLGLICFFVKDQADIFRAPILYVAATIPIIVIFLKKLKFTIRVKLSDFKNMFSHLSGAMTLWLISIFVQIYNGFDIFMLGLFRPIEEVGYFTVSRRVTGSLAVFMLFLANAILPRLSSSFSVDNERFRRDVKKFLWLAVFITLFLLVPIIVFNGFIIKFTIGSGYGPASLPLSIMTLGLILVLFNLPFSTALVACGLEKEVLWQVMGCALLSLILNFILMPTYGMIGASITFVAVEAWALLWIITVYKKRGKKW